MDEELKRLVELLNRYGQRVDREKSIVVVRNRACIEANVPASAGVYWIETTMPVNVMGRAIESVIGRDKPTRRKRPPGAALIRQVDAEFYVAYSGTEDNVCKRLRQHLFNEGGEGTIRLGCVIDEPPFSSYAWRVGFAVIESYEIRYAVEAWWRRHIGWPPFCVR